MGSGEFKEDIADADPAFFDLRFQPAAGDIKKKPPTSEIICF